uniref:Col_cuticle_N domain-containing protein n=1 Tax=Steinernema glaseri TaxID=37863 RepID=A0A1I7ZNT6_9BILA
MSAAAAPVIFPAALAIGGAAVGGTVLSSLITWGVLKDSDVLFAEIKQKKTKVICKRSDLYFWYKWRKHEDC